MRLLADKVATLSAVKLSTATTGPVQQDVLVLRDKLPSDIGGLNRGLFSLGLFVAINLGGHFASL